MFCGKGGVGKSTLSLAMALKLARAGRRVLVISSHPLPELAVGISLAGLSARFPEAASRLFVFHIDPVEQISDLVNKHFPMAIVAQTVLKSSIFQNLIAVAPGLKEFFFLARMQQLAERRASEDAKLPTYDDLIWDAPATGHFLSTLLAARGFDSFLTGPLSAAGAELHRFFSHADTLQIMAVTQPEEMAVAETLELSASLDKNFGIRPAAVLLNAVSPLCTASPEQLAGLNGGASEAMQFALERGLAEREICAKLATDLPVPQMFVPRLVGADLDLLETAGVYL